MMYYRKRHSFTQCALLLYWIAFFCGWVMTTPIIAQEMNYPPAAWSALTKAGANKNSLEGLLVRYRNEGNVEKFRAACFLIVNMPYYEQQGRVISGTERLDSITQSIDHLYFNLVRGQTAEAQETDPLHALIKQNAKESAPMLFTQNLRWSCVDMRKRLECYISNKAKRAGLTPYSPMIVWFAPMYLQEERNKNIYYTIFEGFQ